MRYPLSKYLRKYARPVARTGLRYLFRLVDPSTVGRRATLAARRLGVFETPSTAEVVANYVRGLVLFGRTNDYGASFFWRVFPARAVITSDTAKVPKRLRAYQRREGLEVRYDNDFDTIVQSCRQGRDSWLTPALVDVYLEAQKLGLVATVGTYREGQLVGGLWGLAVGRTFGIMSMFHVVDHAGALALAALVDIVANDGRWSMIDCGTMNSNWERYGAREISRHEFCELVVTKLR